MIIKKNYTHTQTHTMSREPGLSSGVRRYHLLVRNKGSSNSNSERMLWWTEKYQERAVSQKKREGILRRRESQCQTLRKIKSARAAKRICRLKSHLCWGSKNDIVRVEWRSQWGGSERKKMRKII